MANLYFAQTDFQDAVNVVIQYLRDSEFEGSVESGTGIYDVVIKPHALLYAMFSQLVDRTKAYLSLQQATDQFNNSEISEDEYNDAVDSILSNWFVERKGGKPTYGTIRLWFTRPMDFLQLNDGDTIGASGSVSLVVDGDQVFVESDFSVVINATNTYTEYYIDVTVRSSDDVDDLIMEGDEATASVNDIYYLRAEIPTDFLPGISEETSEAFIERTREAITTRELITDRAIYTVLMNEFSEINNVYTAGHGDPEMIRDVLVLENGVKVHYGNKADIYVASALTRTTAKTTVNAYGEANLDAFSTDCDIAHIVRCYRYVDDETTGESYDKEVEIKAIAISETHWGMVGYKPAQIIVEAEEGAEVYFEWLTDPSLVTYQNFVYSEDQRVAAYDPQVKHMFPVMLEFNLKVTLIDEDDTSRDEVATQIVNYVNGLATSGEQYNESELIASIHDAVENVKRVELPISCTATIFDPYSAMDKRASVNNTIDFTTAFGELSKQITSNTIQIFTDTSLITVE